MRRAGLKHLFLICIGPFAALVAILAFNFWAFGHPLATATLIDIESPAFKQPRLLFGQFDWPQWIRLYWITWHRMRGLFVCCPMFLVPLISLMAFLKLPESALHGRAGIFPMLIVIYFVMFGFDFPRLDRRLGHGAAISHTGAAVSLALCTSGLHAVIALICLISVTLSVLNMLAVISVQVLQPEANAARAPQGLVDPVSVAWLPDLCALSPALSPDSYNRGMLMGLHGILSITPILTALIFFHCDRLRGCHFTNKERHLTVGSGSFAPRRKAFGRHPLS